MKKLSVIIADDDQLVLDDLQQMVDWKKLGFHIAAVAKRGEDALELVRRFRPALLITDIQMMGMDGLELTETTQAEFPHMKVLIISAHDEFSYAKRAIASGVMDYLLKTELSTITLSRKLLEVADYFRNVTSSNSAIYEQEFSQFLDSDNNQLIDNFPHLKTVKNEQYYFSVITCSHVFSRDLSKIVLNESRYLQKVKETILQFAKEYFLRPVTCLYKESIILGVHAKDISNSQPLNTLNDFRHRLVQKLNYTSLNFIQFFQTKKLTISNFHTDYKASRPFIHYYQFFCPEAPINMSLWNDLHHYRINAAFPFHSLVLDLEHQDLNCLLIKDYVSECCKAYDIYSLISFYGNFCAKMEVITNNQIQLPQKLHAHLPEVLLKWLFNTLHDCIALITKGNTCQYSSSVTRAISFMEQNYADSSLSSSDIAEYAGLSVNRLGVLIKQDTRKTINEFLSHIRVEKAIHLLKNTNMKIYEISEKCGYQSSQYFSQVIFQKTGKRPIDYRKAKP
ncbi:MAG: response regulator transcription factor [Lachnospiraceae bacterium]